MTEEVAALEAAVLADALPGAVVCGSAISPDGRHAVTLTTLPSAGGYPMDDLFRRVDGHWVEAGGGSSGGGNSGVCFTSLDEEGKLGVLRYADEAPSGSSAALIAYEGREYRVPVREGWVFLAVWGTTYTEEPRLLRWLRRVVSTLPDDQDERGDFTLVVSQGDPLAGERYAVLCASPALETVGGDLVHREFRVHARVKVVPTGELAFGEVRAAQTLRHAVGIPVDQLTSFAALERLELSWVARRWAVVTRLVGNRGRVLRVYLADTADMEGPAVRIPEHVFGLIRTRPGRLVQIESAVAHPEKPDTCIVNKVSAPALAASEYMMTRRESEYDARKKEEKRRKKELLLEGSLEGSSAPSDSAEPRYLWPYRWLGVDPDIDYIFLDKNARYRLGVNPLDPVKVQRSLVNAFENELPFAGLTITAIFVGIATSPLPHTFFTWFFGAAGAAIFTAVATLVKINAGTD